MDQINSQIYHKLKTKIDLTKAQDKNCVQQKNNLIVKNIAEDNGFFFLIELTIEHSYKAVIRIWQNHQAEVMAFYDMDWRSIYETRHGVEFPNHNLRKQSNKQLLSLLG